MTGQAGGAGEASSLGSEWRSLVLKGQLPAGVHGFQVLRSLKTLLKIQDFAEHKSQSWQDPQRPCALLLKSGSTEAPCEGFFWPGQRPKGLAELHQPVWAVLPDASPGRALGRARASWAPGPCTRQPAGSEEPCRRRLCHGVGGPLALGSSTPLLLARATLDGQQSGRGGWQRARSGPHLLSPEPDPDPDTLDPLRLPGLPAGPASAGLQMGD